MTRVLLIDTNYGYTSDLESRLILSDMDDYDFAMSNSADNIAGQVSQRQPDMLIVSAGLLRADPEWNFGIPVYSYAKNAEELALSQEYGIPCYGVIRTASELLAAIEKGITVKTEKPVEEPVKQPTPPNPQKPAPRTESPDPPVTDDEDILSEGRPQQTPVRETQEPGEDRYGRYESSRSEEEDRRDYRDPRYDSRAPYYAHHDRRGQERPEADPYRDEPRRYETAQRYRDDRYYEDDRRYRERPEENARPTRERGSHESDEYRTEEYRANEYNPRNRDLRSLLSEAREKEDEERRRRDAEAAGRLRSEAELEVDRAMGNVRKPAKTIAVYSAKGGVGKTTVACELATYLSLIRKGKTNFKVCIADFDIDFGDVLNTLSYDPNKACMSLWAADIRERLRPMPTDRYGQHSREQLASITYTEQEIELFLQHNEKDGLYALLAPISNEDSMDISEEEVEVMLDNLIQNGGFDFVICDTGNNTKDSSFICLEKADEILMIHTQSVNTVNCNAGLLSMLTKINFDLDKIRLVINKAKPAKSVGVSIQEVQEALTNPNTGQPYKCIAVIKSTDDASHSSNTGEPLVYRSGHEFTKSIASIATEVIDQEFRLQPKKKGFFGRMFGKKNS